jgi:diguanylate cyclase (GGDEF)-like protein/PAS domain S-box-containing protein
MHRISSTIRITVGLACLSVTILLCAQMIGLVPNREAVVLEGRAALCETIAINCSVLASRNDVRSMKSSLEVTVGRYPDMVFAGVRRPDGLFLVEVGNRNDLQGHALQARSGDALMVVPITQGSESWGSVEIGFRPLDANGVSGFLNRGIVKLSLFVGLASLAIYFLYLRKLLQHLDPTRVIPERVRATLDTFAEGLLVLDNQERIVLANQSFALTVGQNPSALQGRPISELEWKHPEDGEKCNRTYPWQWALTKKMPKIGTMLDFQRDGASRRTFMINSSPIMGDGGETRGAMVSFDDVTVMERNRADLHEALDRLQQSRDEVHRQNLELQELAAHDPLTSCLNRRSFFEKFETEWNEALRYGYPLAFVMVDIDHFKSINDHHGHSAGDDVLQRIAAVLRATVRQGDVVCRYGGEEFGILLPHLQIDEACQAAERFRRAICETEFANVSVTASLGVSATGFGAAGFNQLIDQADKSLYAAKNAGRNRVCRWDDTPQEPENAETSPSPVEEREVAIPFHAVTALISALSYRDTGTAEHSRRVADLCAAMAGGCMSVREAYVLETAALLHDIGKIGVPDSILLKPGPLTQDEWHVMTMHDRIGVEIIRSSFACCELADIMSNYRAWYAGNPRSPELPTGDDIPLGARILSIAEAYDAIVSDRVHRRARSDEEAFAELRRCAGTQFDPELVEEFIACVLACDESRRGENPRVCKQTALRIGLQIESLATAVDKQDYVGLAAQAERLKGTAAKYGVPHIVDVAQQLEQSAREGKDHVQLAKLTNDLFDLCRSTQSAYFDDSNYTDPVQIDEVDANTLLTGAS